MARVPRFDDQLDMARRQREEIRAMRIRPHAHTVDRCFIVGDAITTGMFIPPIFIGIDSDDSAPEWKYVASLQAKLRTGTCTIEWLHNGSLFATQNVTNIAADAYMDLSPAVELSHKDEIQATISADASAFDLSAAVVVVSQPS